MAKDFENAKTTKGIHYSRYISSWKRMGGKLYIDENSLFMRWLKEEEKLTDEEISDIHFLLTTGRMELERSASAFMNRHYDEMVQEKEDTYKECF